MFCRLWQFTRKIQSPSLTERLELKRQAARLVRPEKGTGKGESGYCSLAGRRKEMVIVPQVSGPGALKGAQDPGLDRALYAL